MKNYVLLTTYTNCTHYTNQHVKDSVLQPFKYSLSNFVKRDSIHHFAYNLAH